MASSRATSHDYRRQKVPVREFERDLGLHPVRRSVAAERRAATKGELEHGLRAGQPSSCRKTLQLSKIFPQKNPQVILSYKYFLIGMIFAGCCITVNSSLGAYMKRLLLATLLASAGFQANATVINFNNNDAQSYFVPSVTSNGFVATPTPAGDYNIGTSDNFDGNGAANGTVYLTTWSNSFASTGVQLKNVDSNTFSLQSFDFDNAYNRFGEDYERTSAITVTGTYADNTTVSQIFINLRDITSFTTLNLSGNFTGLKSVTFTANGDSSVRALYDNIVVNEPATSDVPEPASLALLGLGFLGMSVLRRKNKV